MVNENAYVLGTARSRIRDLFDYGRLRAAEIGAENVFDLSMGNPSVPAPPEVRAALLELAASDDFLSVHGYTSAVGDEATRAAIAADLNARFGAGVRAQDLFLGCGAAAELAAVFRAISAPDAEVLAIAPYFPEYAVYAHAAGLRFRAVPPDIPNFQIQTDALADMLSPHTAAVIVNSPNNPSGAVYTQETLLALTALLRRKAAQFGHPIYLIADEPYRELVYDGTTVAFLPMLYADTIVCYSYSKSLSLPGARIGYIYIPQQAAQHDALFSAVCGASRELGHVCAPSVWQKVIARCAHLRPDLREYDRNRRVLCDALRRYGYEVAPPCGAFYLFVRAPGGDACAFSEAAKQLDLLIAPGDDFGCPGWLRLCYCIRHDTIVRSLPVFRRLIGEASAQSTQNSEKNDKKTP